MNDSYKHILDQLDVLIHALGKAEISRRLYISRSTLYMWLKHPEKMTIQNVIDIRTLYLRWKSFVGEA